MRIKESDVCYLSVNEAENIAKRHEDEADWDIWEDCYANAAGALKDELSKYWVNGEVQLVI